MAFGGLLVVLVVAVTAPLVVGLAPAIRVPAVVLEILLGVIIGPSVLGWVEIDVPIQVVSVIGLSFLLFLAGMEIDLERLRGRTLRLAGLGLLASAAVALVVGVGLDAAGLGQALFLAIVLLATSLGLVVPVLKDAGHAESGTGQLVIAGATPRGGRWPPPGRRRRGPIRCSHLRPVTSPPPPIGLQPLRAVR